MIRKIESAIRRGISKALNEDSVYDGWVKNCENRTSDVLAKEMMTKIKKYISQNKQENYISIVMNYGQNGYGIRPFGTGCEDRQRKKECLVTYTMGIDGLEVKYEFMNQSALGSLSKKLVEELKKQYEDVIINMKSIGENWNYTDVIDNIAIINPCKEFTKLQKLILKKTGYELKPLDLYRVRTSGKRGAYYEDVRDRNYLSVDPQKCSRELENLTKFFKPRRECKCKIVHHSDTSDRNYSMYYETECYGSKETALEITQSTSTGRSTEKYTIYS